jgi:hypothetical protein
LKGAVTGNVEISNIEAFTKTSSDLDLNSIDLISTTPFEPQSEATFELNIENQRIAPVSSGRATGQIFFSSEQIEHPQIKSEYTIVDFVDSAPDAIDEVIDEKGSEEKNEAIPVKLDRPAYYSWREGNYFNNGVEFFCTKVGFITPTIT